MTTKEQYAQLNVQKQQQSFEDNMMSQMMPMFTSMFGGLTGNLSPQQSNTMQGHADNLKNNGYTPGNISECLDNMNNDADAQSKPHVKGFSDHVHQKMKDITKDYNDQGHLTEIHKKVYSENSS